MPITASVAEGDGTVEVCATLSDVATGGYSTINIMLATLDFGMHYLVASSG